MKIAKKRKAGEILDRGGISQRIIQIATEISTGTYKEAIEKAGQIHVLVDAATFDSYWDGKAMNGKMFEESVLSSLNDKIITRDDVMHKVNPYDNE